MPAVPARVMVVASTQTSVTLLPAPSTGVEKVPALAVKVRVNELPSTSANTTADRSTSPSVSSMTVTVAGALDRVGISLTATISRLITGLEARLSVASVALRVMVAASSPFT